MAKSPLKKEDSFPLEYKNWLTSMPVRAMEKHHRADYMDLLCWVAAEKGKGVKDDDKALMKLLHCTAEDLAIIKQKFDVKDGYLFNKKLSELMDNEPVKVEKVNKKQISIFDVPDGLSVEEQKEFLRKKLYDDIKKFVDENNHKYNYSKTMLTKFYRHWASDVVDDHSKIAMQKQKTWDLELRLMNWNERYLKENPPSGVQSKSEKLLNASTGAEEKMKQLNSNGQGTKQARLH